MTKSTTFLLFFFLFNNSTHTMHQYHPKKLDLMMDELHGNSKPKTSRSLIKNFVYDYKQIKLNHKNQENTKILKNQRLEKLYS